jgi:probable HAF family extracellular repeat protein
MEAEMEGVHQIRMSPLLGIVAASLFGCADAERAVGPMDETVPALAANPSGPLAVKEMFGLEPLIGSSGDHSTAFDINDLGHVVGASGSPLGTRAVRWNPDSSRFPEDLQTLPGGGFSEALAINDNGTIIVGWSEDANSDLHAVRWVRANNTWVIQDLGTLGGTDSRAFDITPDGAIVGTSQTMSGKAGFLWRNGVMQGIGIFSVEDARAVNGQGEIVGQNAFGEAVLLVLMNPIGLQPLGTLGGATSIALDINDRREIVGSSDDATNKSAAFLWTARNGMVDLGGRGGNTIANGINTSGHVVGLSADLGGTPHAMVWAKGKVLDLGVLPGHSESGAEAINDDREIVGWSFTPTVAKRATLWRLK